VHSIIVHSKFGVLNVFFDMLLHKIMTFRLDFQNFKKINDNNFHTWNMKMELLQHVNNLWKIISRDLLSIEIEFGKIICE